jgi:hypothetical protein
MVSKFSVLIVCVLAAGLACAKASIPQDIQSFIVNADACGHAAGERGHEIIPKGMFHDRHGDHQETSRKEKAVSIPS